MFYEKNKDKGFLESLDFPSIEKKESAIYIFEFINFLRLRSKNNSIIEFSKLSDIEDYLRKQWSALFQRLLYEQRTIKSESRRLEAFSEELKDIKSLILSSITTGQAKEVGRGVLKYRRLIEFLLGFNYSTISQLLLDDISWENLLEKFDIVEITVIENTNRFRPLVFLVKRDGTFYESRYSLVIFQRMATDWESFRQLGAPIKQEVFSALAENLTHGPMMPIRYRSQEFANFLQEFSDSKDSSTTTTLNPNTISASKSSTTEEED